VTVFNTSVAASNAAQTNNITLYYITTREPEDFNKMDPLNPNYTAGNDEYQNFSKLKEQLACKNGTIVIFVHGWEESEKNVEERLNRVKLSLANNNYTGPLIGFSWPSDTVWLGAQFIAKENGPKLAKLIFDIKNACPEADTRIIAHSLGARIVLSSLDSLHKNPLWNLKNFTISSIHLMGAAVDDEEVSNRSEFITIDQTNWGSPKSDYGEAIGAEVIKFTNLFSSEDNMLEASPDAPSLPIYPIFESDLALGQMGYQKFPDPDPNNTSLSYNLMKRESLPNNYIENDIKNELVAICDADADGHPDKPFKDGQTIAIGDNHRGYLGYRYNETKIIDDGAIGLVVSSWDN
ncbi:MAG: alpha/beta hydrolase, partial [Nitrososphaeraceae archaeon]